jgi:transposase
MPMVVLGIDAHKRTHTVVAVDEVGRQLGVRVTKTTSTAAHLELVVWAERFGGGRRWAVEDCRTCRGGWSGTCWRLGSRSCGCRRS